MLIDLILEVINSGSSEKRDILIDAYDQIRNSNEEGIMFINEIGYAIRSNKFTAYVDVVDRIVVVFEDRRIPIFIDDYEEGGLIVTREMFMLLGRHHYYLYHPSIGKIVGKLSNTTTMIPPASGYIIEHKKNQRFKIQGTPEEIQLFDSYLYKIVNAIGDNGGDEIEFICKKWKNELQIELQSDMAHGYPTEEVILHVTNQLGSSGYSSLITDHDGMINLLI